MTLQEEEQPLTDAELVMRFPSVPWRDPVRISDFHGNFGFACRFCIARHGIGRDIPSLSMSAREVRRHIGEHHPWSVGHCMSSEHFGQLAWQFKRMSGSSGLKVQAAIAC